MADDAVVHSGGNTPEQVAYKLMHDIAAIEGKTLLTTTGAPGAPASGEVLGLLGIGGGVHPLGGCENGLGSAGPSPRSTPWRGGYRPRCAPVKPSRP